mmetsp:Transcript_26208/g.64711  ORF Transcript_26208/g.64711 Transcript_26208/m.64711 type:complete len:915 (-) Transcript_26208:860-3604(-)
MRAGRGVRLGLLALAVLLSVLGAAEGSYRFGTLSWRAVKDADATNTVEFELVTGWRRDFQWVYVRQVDGGTRTLEDTPIVGDVLRVTGLFDQNGFADQQGTGTQAIDGGTSEIMFHAGDGSKYFVDMTVTSFSESENWIMATTLIRHTYATPYSGKKENIYPAGFSYSAGSPDDLAANQPFSHVPWTASFVGCCRADLPTLPAVGGNANKPYRVETLVDLTDRDNAPASRTLPVVTVPATGTPFFYVVAKDQLMQSSDAPPRMSAGITNYPVQPSDAFANLTYKVASAGDLGLPASQYAPFSGFSIDSKGRVTFAAGGVQGYYQVAVVIFSNSSKTIVDFMVRAVAPTGMPMANGADLKEMVNGWVGFKVGHPQTISLSVRDPNGDRLVLNYVFAGLNVAASSVAKNAQGINTGITYSPLELNHQGLPPGARVYSTAVHGISDIKISFDNPFEAHRPQHNAAVNKIQRDYTNAPNADELWAMGYRPVNMTGATGLNVNALADTISKTAFNLNSGTGGAAVYLWVLRSSTEACVTEIMVSTSPEQEKQMMDNGFTKLPHNLNEQSSSMAKVYLWFKKGSGPALVDIHLRDIAVQGACCAADDQMMYSMNEVGMACPTCPGGYELVPANLNYGASQNKLLMYVQHAPEGNISKVLSWVPQVPGHYLMCYSAQEADTVAKLSSTQRCIDMNIRADPAPMFVPLPELHTNMGKTLTFKVAYMDILHIDEEVSIAMDTTKHVLQGSRFVGDVMISDHPMGRETARMVEWFPDASYGGLSGEVCFTATDAGGDFKIADMTTGCIMVHVERCKWWVQTEDTLVQVAARFQTNWLQVWHLNPTILHPDNSLPPGQVINTGHMYQVEPSDSLSALAQRFGTTVAHIRMNNWDMVGMTDQGLMVGMHICVIPNSCVTAVNVQRE